MKNQIIKLHDEFVNKGMSPSILNKHECLWFKGYLLTDKDIGYVLLDMQTWLREKHRIYFWMHCCEEKKIGCEYTACIRKTDKYGWSLGSGKPSKDYNEALLFGLQEAIKLIE